MASVLFSVCVAFSLFCVQAANELARGWGDEIDWMPLDKAWEKSQEEKKVLMLVIHKTWCGACKALKPKFAESAEIRKLSSEFVMVNVEDNEEPSEEKYRPDGGYIPRILFFGPDGKLLDEYNKNGNAKYKYFYGNAESVVDSMKNVLKSAGTGSESVKKEL
ncbi:hypothetical protein BaRGS_00007528 [Batillaria attramentaria]|uniref:Thioredoxin domain-containing protein n=1 Tax=Batillaria attramentaria TaxID=370345 RepID=A0ABD0LP95_9CAEN